MRHTRNRQIFNSKQKVLLGKYNKNYPIKTVRERMIYTLDPTFKWHREYGREIMPWGQNYISFGNVVRLVKF